MSSPFGRAPSPRTNGHDQHAAESTSTLLGRQVAALKAMLRLDAGVDDQAAGGGLLGPQWKVLVFDRVGQDLLSPVLNVRALREEGVTLHLHITSDR